MLEKEWYGAGEVARLLGVHRNSVSRWCRQGKVESQQFGSQRGYFLPQVEVERLLKENEATAVTEAEAE